MVNIHNYQVCSSVNDRCVTSADATYITTIRQPLRPSQGFFYILINLLLTKTCTMKTIYDKNPKKILGYFMATDNFCPTAPPITQNAVTIETYGAYASEATWELTDASGTVLYSGAGFGTTSAMLTLGDCYDMTMLDSYGDGWSDWGGTTSGYTITDDVDGTVYANVDGANFLTVQTDNFCPTAPPITQNAVTIETYGAYASEATWELTDASGTVLYSGAGFGTTSAMLTLGDCYDMTMLDSYGDGWSDWGGTTSGYTITDDVDGTVYANVDGANFLTVQTDNFCPTAPPITQNAVTIETYGAYASEATWELTDASGTVLYSGAGFGTTSAMLTLGDCYDMTMLDSYGDGWSDWGGTTSGYTITDDVDGTVYANVDGANFLTVQTDNFCPTAPPITQNAVTIETYGAYASEATWELTDASGTVLYSGAGFGTTSAMLTLGDCYDMTMLDSYGDGWSDWGGTTSGYTITDDVDGTVYANVDGANFLTVQTDNFCPTAPPINVSGCMDPLATNYNSTATADCDNVVGGTDTTCCTYPIVNDDCATAEAIACGASAVGNNTGASANSPSTGAAVWYSVLGQGGDITVSTCGTAFDTRLYIFDSCGGSYIAYNDDACAGSPLGGSSYASTVTFTSFPGTVYFIAAAGYSSFTSTGAINISVTCGTPYVYGCTNLGASNYDPLANLDDGSCILPGCLDINAINYCAVCTVNDSSCVYPVANVLDFCDDFESTSLSTNGWTSITGSEAGQFIGLTSVNAIADTVSIESTGSDAYAGWVDNSTEAEVFANTSHVNSATIRLDMSAQSGIVNLGFDYQTQSYFTNASPDPNVGTSALSTFRVKVNGNVVSDINGNSWHGLETVTSLLYDLSAYAGDSSVFVTFETSVCLNENYGAGYGDFVWIDNVCAYEVTPCTNYGIAAGYSFDASCNGGSDGQASANAFGDTAFTYSNSYDWTDASGVSVGTGSAVSGLSAGTYTCTVTDATNGCSASTSVTIGEPTSIVVLGNILDATAPVNTDGSVSLSSSGGSPCFTGANDTLNTWDGGTEYVWSGVATGMTNYFDITATNGSGITGFDINGVYAVAGNIEIWTRTGTSNGYTTDASGWTLNTSIPNSAAGNGVTVYVPLMTTIGMSVGDITGIAIYTPGDHFMTLGGFDAYTATLASDANISVSTGVMCANGPVFGGASTYGGVASSSNFTGNVHYTAPTYTYAWSNGATTANVSNLGMGPIAVTVTDCNGCTGTWSGFVAANIVNGCTDPLASNFDPLANTDDSTCTYPGCIDPLATNFDSTANLSDGSCTYTCQYNGFDDEITITAFIDLSAGEGSWQLIDANGIDTVASAAAGSMTTSAAYVTTACADDGCYFLYFQDSYGDGWIDWNQTQGYIMTQNSNGDTLSFDFVTGTGGSAAVSVGGVTCILGCTDATATNYDPAATSDDGSCFSTGCTGAPLNWAYCYDNNQLVGEVFTGNTASDIVTIIFNAGEIEVSWDALTIYDGSDNTAPILLATDGDLTGLMVQSTGQYLYVEIESDGSVSCASGSKTSIDADYYCSSLLVLGCTDSTAVNYDATANSDDGSCIFNGCTDTLAANYDANATTDDGSCWYSGCTDSPLNWAYCYDNNQLGGAVFQGNTASDIVTLLFNAGEIEVYWDALTIYDGYDNTAPILLATDGDLTGIMVQSTGQYLYVEIESDGSVSCASGSKTSIDADYYCSSIAVEGCTDSTATNYNALATIDDGSCTYPCLLDEVTLTMTDSYGDTWNGAYLDY